MKVSFYLSRPKDNRVSVVIAQINFNMTSYRYYLTIKIHPSDWNPKTQRAKQVAKCTESIEFNHLLKNIYSIGKLITQIKVVMREALELGYTNNTIFTHRKFRPACVETDAVYLTDKEVSSLDLSDHVKLERVYDLFIIDCYTGLRFSDLSELSIENVDEDILEVRQIKTGDRVYIPLQPEVKAIMGRYDGDFPVRFPIRNSTSI